MHDRAIAKASGLSKTMAFFVLAYNYVVAIKEIALRRLRVYHRFFIYNVSMYNCTIIHAFEHSL